MNHNLLVGQSGGPTAVINGSLYGVVSEGLANPEIDNVIGMVNGIEGFLADHTIDMAPLKENGELERIRTTPGSYLGSCRYKLPEIHEDREVYDKIFEILNKLEIEAFIYIGGNDSMDTVSKLSRYAASIESPIRFIGVPKTIDNDLWGTDVTFGFQSAINLATQTIDCIHTTAASHGRVFIVEIMGHKVGWLTLHAGIAGGADIILVPEIPYDINKVAAAVNKRAKEGKRFSIIAVAEGAISKEQAALSKKEYKKYIATRQYPSISYEIGAKISELTGQEVRVAVPGHMQRGGSPCPYDRVLSTRLGAAAGKMILDGEFGYLVGMKNNHIAKIPLADVAGKLKMIQPDDEMVQ